MPEWGRGIQPINILGVRILSVKDVYYAPQFGTLITPKGDVLRTTFSEAKFYTPTFRKLPHFVWEDEAALFRPPTKIETYNEYGIFLPWGGIHNYGHFVIDSMTAMWHLSAASDRQVKFLSPPLKNWQKEHIELLDQGSLPTETNSALVFVRQAYFANVMDHFLHRVGPSIRDLRDRQMSRVKLDQTLGKKKLYLARPEDNTKRTLLNEAEIQQCLTADGFEVVYPETMKVRDQITLFASAKVVIAPTGAALTNIIYCRPGTCVIEIQPAHARQIWVRNLCIQCDLKWLPYFAASMPCEKVVHIEGVPHPQIGITFQVSVQSIKGLLETSERLI